MTLKEAYRVLRRFEDWLDAFWRGLSPQNQDRGRRKKKGVVA